MSSWGRWKEEHPKSPATALWSQGCAVLGAAHGSLRGAVVRPWLLVKYKPTFLLFFFN